MNPVSIVLSLIKNIPIKIWFSLGVASIIFLVSLYINNLQSQITERDDTISNLLVESKITAAEKSALQLALVDQNSSIDSLVKNGDKLKEELDRLRRQTTPSIEYGTIQESLRTATIPSDCLQAMSWHSQNMRRFEQKYTKDGQ
jgi:hypothetical protein